MSSKSIRERTYIHLPDDPSCVQIGAGRADADGVTVTLRIGDGEPGETVVFICCAEQLDRIAEEAARAADWMRRAQIVQAQLAAIQTAPNASAAPPSAIAL
jgi:hypothetical protein